MIGMVQANVAAAALREFPVIEEAPASDIFLGIIYTTGPKLIVAVSKTVWILDSGATRQVSGDRTRFPDLVDYEDSPDTAIGEQSAITGKGNIDLSVGDTRLAPGFATLTSCGGERESSIYRQQRPIVGIWRLLLQKYTSEASMSLYLQGGSTCRPYLSVAHPHKNNSTSHRHTTNTTKTWIAGLQLERPSLRPKIVRVAVTMSRLLELKCVARSNFAI